MKRGRRRKPRIAKFVGLFLGLAGSALIIHNVPLHIWYIALAAAVMALMICFIRPK